MQPKVPDEVRWLVNEYLPTMEHVDVLVHLAREEPAAKSMADIVASLSMNPETAARRIEDVVEAGLVAAEAGPGGEKVYSYRPPGIKQRMAVSSLLETYNARPVSLIRFVYERPPDSIQRLADAFRLRKPRP